MTPDERQFGSSATESFLLPEDVVVHRTMNVCHSYDGHVSLVRQPCVHRTTDDNYIGADINRPAGENSIP